ncbi:hypothetical protein LINGRAHAP2_LOCUS6369 [Linum grandiflorum]
MNESESAGILESQLPLDITLKIASSLPVLDVCALASCSPFWRELCSSDSIWELLARRRWPSPTFLNDSSSSNSGWKEVYVGKHREIAERASMMIGNFNPSCGAESMEVGNYLKAIDDLSGMELGFGDVQMLLFKPNLSVLLNLVALHYCLFRLKSPAWEVVEALKTCKISERQVCVKWWKLGRWFYGFRMRDESHSRQVSLEEMVTQEEGKMVFGVLRRGAIHEVLRVLISVETVASSSWPCSRSE